MKSVKLFVLMMLILTTSVACYGFRSRRLGRLVDAVVAVPGDDLQDAYDYLTSSDRAGQMGAVSISNQRTLLLTAGSYTSDALVLDTDYVNIVGIGDVTIVDSSGAAIDCGDKICSIRDVRIQASSIANCLTNDANVILENVTLSDGTDMEHYPVDANSSGLTIADDKKIWFGTDSDAVLQYDEDGDDNLQLTGSNFCFSGVNAVFEGSTADNYETTLTVDDPTGDRTITIPDITGGMPVVIAQIYTDTNSISTSAEDVTGSSISIPSGWNEAGYTIHWRLQGDVTGDNDQVHLAVYNGDSEAATLATTDATGAEGDWTADIYYVITDSNAQSIHGVMTCGDDDDVVYVNATDTEDLSSGDTVKLQIYVDNTSDDMRVEYGVATAWKQAE